MMDSKDLRILSLHKIEIMCIQIMFIIEHLNRNSPNSHSKYCICIKTAIV